MKRILRYLHGTINHGLVFKPAISVHHLQLRGFSDADWATDPDDLRSTSAACIYLGPNLVSWWSKKQQRTSRSNTEVEYRSLAAAAAEVLWIQSLLRELHLPYSVPILFCDNLSTVLLSHNPVLHAKTKHIELDLFFL
jgi:hypothetical protein